MRSLLSLLFALLLLSCGNNEGASTPQNLPASDSAAESPPEASVPTVSNKASTDGSVKALEERHALIPSDPSIAQDLAYAYAEQKNPKALSLADSLITLRAPEPEKAYYSKAEYFSRTGNVREAVKNYDAAIAANLRFLDAHMDKGQLLFRQKQYEAALRTFATGQKLSVDEPMFYFWIAKTQEAAGDKQDAKANYERAFALDKTLTEAREAANRLE